jgi:hypothetical protein
MAESFEKRLRERKKREEREAKAAEQRAKTRARRTGTELPKRPEHPQVVLHEDVVQEGPPS